MGACCRRIAGLETSLGYIARTCVLYSRTPVLEQLVGKDLRNGVYGSAELTRLCQSELSHCLSHKSS